MQLQKHSNQKPGSIITSPQRMVLQDLSPILPDPLGQNGSQVSLRKAILQCVSDLARRVGDSLHLLGALGGIVGKLLGPSPLTTAVLECVAAAALAVNFFPAKVRWHCVHALHRCFPSCSACLILQWNCLLTSAWPVLAHLVCLACKYCSYCV